MAKKKPSGSRKTTTKKSAKAAKSQKSPAKKSPAKKKSARKAKPAPVATDAAPPATEPVSSTMKPAPVPDRRKERRAPEKPSETKPAEPFAPAETSEPDTRGPAHGFSAGDADIMSGERANDPLLVECAWEVVNQVGGIYTVIRSKLPAMNERWGARYCLVGPYMHGTASVEFEAMEPTGPFGEAVQALKDMGIEAHYGRWLVMGRPRVVLLDIGSAYWRLGEIRAKLFHDHGIPMPDGDPLLNDVAAFGELVRIFVQTLAEKQAASRRIVAHFHEWMGSTAIPSLRRDNVPVSTVFTTHATMLGRYVAGNDPWYYDHVPFVNWEADSARFNILPQVNIERAAAHGAHVFTTVSNITAFECEHLLGRKPDVVTPNGLNIQRFTSGHEFQNLHNTYKQQIHEFVMGHFFPSYSFDLDKTLYGFISGRYEYRNKGYDMSVEAMARLNAKLKASGSDRTFIFFLITRQPNRGINSEVLRCRAVMDELRRVCNAIKDQIGERLFSAAATDSNVHLPDLVDEYWWLRMRRTVQAWKTGRWPIVVTHDLVDDRTDEVLAQLRKVGLLNHADDRVKVVYHPEFISATNPLWGMEYDQFVRGCHVGVFPSFYEPWGYTPLECIASGIPAVTSDVSGFGSYVLDNIEDPEKAGIHVLRRRFCGFDDSSEQLAEYLMRLISLDRKTRIGLRNRIDQRSDHFDWSNLARWYDDAHALALERAAV